MYIVTNWVVVFYIMYHTVRNKRAAARMMKKMQEHSKDQLMKDKIRFTQNLRDKKKQEFNEVQREKVKQDDQNPERMDSFINEGIVPQSELAEDHFSKTSFAPQLPMLNTYNNFKNSSNSLSSMRLEPSPNPRGRVNSTFYPGSPLGKLASGAPDFYHAPSENPGSAENKEASMEGEEAG